MGSLRAARLGDPVFGAETLQAAPMGGGTESQVGAVQEGGSLNRLPRLGTETHNISIRSPLSAVACLGVLCSSPYFISCRAPKMGSLGLRVHGVSEPFDSMGNTQKSTCMLAQTHRNQSTQVPPLRGTG